jgi:hypothetical protein
MNEAVSNHDWGAALRAAFEYVASSPPLDDWSNVAAFSMSMVILNCGLCYCLFCGIPLQILCRKQRQKVLRNRFAKLKAKQNTHPYDISTESLRGERDSSFKPPVIADEYIGGEADVLEANSHNNFRFEELVSIVHCTGSTTFFFDGKFDALLFETLDADKSGTIDVSEFVAGRTNRGLQFTLQLANCPALSDLFHGSDADIRRQLRRAGLIKKKDDCEVPRDAWDFFVEFNRNSRLLYYKCKTLAMNKLYFGKGMEPGKRSSAPMIDALAALVMPRGWLQDYKHHICNSHPIISVIFGSQYSVFSPLQRMQVLLIDFFACSSLTVIQIYVIELGELSTSGAASENFNNFWTTLLIVTIPQRYLHRLVNCIGAILLIGDDSANGSRGMLNRCCNHISQALAASLLTFVFFASCGAAFYVLWLVLDSPILIGNGTGTSVIINILIGYVYSLVMPLLQEYNPSSDVFRFALFLIDVKNFRSQEASSAVGKKVAVFDRGVTTYWFKNEILSELGTGIVERVYASDEVIVLLDDPDRALRYNDHLLKESQNQFRWARRYPRIPLEESRVILKVVSLASLEICGKEVVIISTSQPKYDGMVAKCNSFLGRRGVYEVSMASGELCHFPHDNVRLFSGSELQSTSDDTHKHASEENADLETIRSSKIYNKELLPDVEYEHRSQAGHAAKEISLPESSDIGQKFSKVSSDPSWWVLLLNLDEAGLRQKARLRAAKIHLDSASLASKAWLAAQAVRSHAEVLTTNRDMPKEGADKQNFDKSTIIREGTVPLDKTLSGDAEPAALSHVKANAAAFLAAEAVARARARAQFEAERFARSWLGITVGPLLGWYILDYLQMCAWRRERAKVLGIIRDAITEHGSQHMSDPQVHSSALRARETAAYVLQEGGSVRLRGPNVAGSRESSHSNRESVASSDSTLDRIVPGVPRGTHGIVVRGIGSFLEANGFKYRHLTPDLRVHVLFPHGRRIVPADWLEEVIEDPLSTSSAALRVDTPSQTPIRKWKQTLASREKRLHAAQSQKSAADHLEMGLTDEGVHERLQTYNAMLSRPHQ